MKVSTLLAVYKESGNPFHNDGALTLNDLAANVCLLTLGITNCLYLSLDLSILLDDGITDRRSNKYSSVSPFKHLYVIVSSYAQFLH